MPLLGLTAVERQRVGDNRGFFSRIFCAEELSECGWNKPIAQINHTYTSKMGTVRGMHYQYPPYSEMKLVTCIRGEVFDVAVDLRYGSPTFLQWYGISLSATNNRALLIPEGFGHGFQAITDEVELMYCHSVAYEPSAEGGLNPLDHRLAITWPLPISEMSARDTAHPAITETFTGVLL